MTRTCPYTPYPDSFHGEVSKLTTVATTILASRFILVPTEDVFTFSHSATIHHRPQPLRSVEQPSNVHRHLRPLWLHPHTALALAILSILRC